MEIYYGQKKSVDSGYHNYNTMFEIDNGEVFIGGVDQAKSDGSPYYASILKIDSLGNLLYAKSFPNAQIFTDIVNSGTNIYILAGTDFSSIYLATIDTFGNACNTTLPDNSIQVSDAQLTTLTC